MKTQRLAFTIAVAASSTLNLVAYSQTSTGTNSSAPTLRPPLSTTTTPTTNPSPVTTTTNPSPATSPSTNNPWNTAPTLEHGGIVPSPQTTPSTLPAAVTGTPAVPNGALSPTTSGAPNTTGILDLGAAPAPAPLMGTITQEVAFTIDKQEISRGPFVGLVLHLHNGTNSPLVFDGDRIRMKVGNQTLTAVTDAQLEGVTAPPPNPVQEAKRAIVDAVTVGSVAAIHDQLIEMGPVLPRYGDDQKRRQATSERFGTRILWPGDDTQGIVYFCTSQKLNGGLIELPVVTFPQMEIRGYLSTLR